jgi:hypothetical protein
MSLRLLRPSRISWAALIGLLWAVTIGALRDFVWADLRKGLIRLGGLTRVVRILIRFGFGVLFVMLFVLVFNDFWRQQFDLRSGNLDTPGRGNLIPVILLPVSLFLMAIAWSYALAGARAVHPLLGALPLFLYVTTAVTTLAGIAEPGPFILIAGWGSLAVVVLLFLIPAARRLPAELSFLIFLTLVGVQFALGQSALLEQDRLSGLGLGQINLESSIETLGSLSLPLLLLIGMDIARFVQQASTWVTLVVRQRLPDALVYLALIGALGWLLYLQTARLLEFVDLHGESAAMLAYLGGLGTVVVIVAVWWVMGRLVAPHGLPAMRPAVLGETAEGIALWLILARLLTMLIAFMLFQVVGMLSALALAQSGEIQNIGLLIIAALSWLASALTTYHTAWLWLVAAGALLLALWLARRGRHAAALYVGAYGAYDLWNLATARAGPLAKLTWDNQDQVHLWFALWLLGATLFWVLRHQLTPARGGGLLFLTLILLLLRQTDFIENPFSPFFGFAGIGFVAFGLAWDALTAGSWANIGTPFLPRAGRIFLYIGYVLLTVTLVNWALATHNLDFIGQFSGDTALLGLNAFGKPLLYLLFPIVMMLPAEEEVE